MSSIFDGTQVPAWLQDLTALPKGQAGHSLGLALGAGLLALQPNEDGDGLKGFGEGLKEARLNEQDPNWRVKTKSLEANAVSNWARAATEWQQLDATTKDMSDWMMYDLPAITKYQEELKSDPDAVPPVARSSKGQQALQQMETGRLRKATLDFKKEQAENMLDIQQQRVDNASEAAKQEIEDVKYFNKTLPTVKSPAERVRIRTLQKSGKTVEAMQALEAAEKEATAGKSAKETAAVRNIEQINEWEKQAKEAEAAGDTELAKDLRKNSSMLQEQLKGWGMTMGYDDQGRAIFSMGKGGQPTVATQTMAQTKLLQYENASQLIDYLGKNLTSQHVGLAGAAGELIFDKSMEQIVPGSENKERVRVRTTLTGLRETLMREMSDDRSGRFSAADREEVERALPSSGVFESEADAKDRLERVREILSNRSKVYARSMGVGAPAWTLDESDKDEIVKRYHEGLASKLDPSSAEFKKRFLTKEEALDALTRKPQVPPQ